MSINAAALLARIKKRKQELNAAKPNPYITADPQAKRRHVRLLSHIEAVDNELDLVPKQPPVASFLLKSADVDSLVWQPKHVKKPQVYTLPLTPEEKKRKLKLSKLQKQEEIRKQKELGINVDKPKLTVRNVAAVLGAEYLKDPTKYELQAQQEMQQRRDEHDRMNAERKLSKDEKWEKQHAKYIQNRAKLHCLIARIHVSSRTKAILNSNITELCGTGVLLVSNESGLVILEAGERECFLLNKLIAKLDKDYCLLWKGQTKKAKFQKYTVHYPKDLKQFLKNYELESVYWLDKDTK